MASSGCDLVAKLGVPFWPFFHALFLLSPDQFVSTFVHFRCSVSLSVFVCLVVYNLVVFWLFSEAGHNGVLLVQRRVNVREWAAECMLYSKIVSRIGTNLLYMFVPSWIILNCFACGVLF